MINNSGPTEPRKQPVATSSYTCRTNPLFDASYSPETLPGHQGNACAGVCAARRQVTSTRGTRPREDRCEQDQSGMGLSCTSRISSHRRGPESTTTTAGATTIPVPITNPTVAAANTNTATTASPIPTWRDVFWIWMSVPCQASLNDHSCDVPLSKTPARQPPPSPSLLPYPAFPCASSGLYHTALTCNLITRILSYLSPH